MCVAALENFDPKRLPTKVSRQVRTLLDGSFLDRRENLLVLSNPGSGKTHLLCAIGQELLVRTGAADSVHVMRVAGEGAAGGEARFEAEPRHQAVGAI